MAKNFFTSSLWSIMQRYVPSLIHIIATLIISRMISPGDFGEVAIVTSFNQIACLIISSGLGEGIIWKSDFSQRMLSSVFIFNVSLATILYLLLFFASPFIAYFYDLERLNILIKIIGLNMIIYALSYVQRILFQKDLEFRLLAKISLVASILASVIGIVLAYRGYGIWSIVIMVMLLNAFELLLLWFYSSWKPTTEFSLKSLMQILPYSIRILLSNCIQVVYDNIYSLTIGKALNSKALGYFNRMQTVTYYTTTNFVYAIECVFFPLLCKNKEDKIQLEQSFYKLIRVTTLCCFAILALMIGQSRELVLIILTDRWAGGIPVLRMLSIAFVFVPISYINNSFLKIHGKSNILLRGNIIKKSIGLLILFISIAFKRLDIICYGVVLYNFIDAIISLYMSHKYIGIKICEQLNVLRNNIVFLVLSVITTSMVSYLVTNIYFSFLLALIMVCVSFFIVHFCGKTQELNLLKQIITQLRVK